MIIDAHRHVWSLYQRYPRTVEIAARDAGKPDPVHAHVETLPLVPDWRQTGQEIVAELDEAGVDRSVIFVADYGLRLGEAVFTPEGENRISVELMRTYPDRLIAFFGIDPRRPGSADLFQRAAQEWGVKGLKMHTTVGYFPHDRSAYPLYEVCVAHGLPVSFHTGPMPSPLVSRFAQPLHFDEVAADFPDLTVIMGHAGRALWPEALNVARMKPNVYLELSTWQAHFAYVQEFLYAIDRMRDTIGIERILWGSDNPGWRHAMPLKEWVQVFQQLPSLGKKHGFHFSDADVEAILGGNTARILKLP